ncbi:MAG: hypothetical protein SOX82_02505 [Eubacteriales bacterium]|nr:hypothetical protein [Eubacteriales bacterium]
MTKHQLHGWCGVTERRYRVFSTFMPIRPNLMKLCMPQNGCIKILWTKKQKVFVSVLLNLTVAHLIGKMLPEAY